MIDLTQSSACELCKIARSTGALFLDHREPLIPIPDCIPYCRSTVFGPKLHLVTHPLELCAISSLCVQIVPAKRKKERRGRQAAHLKLQLQTTGETIGLGARSSKDMAWTWFPHHVRCAYPAIVLHPDLLSWKGNTFDRTRCCR